MRLAHRRRGAIVPVTAVMLVFLLGMIAFAVDVGWIAVVQSDLQNAADSAALAGANTMMDAAVQYNLPNQSAQNKTKILSAAEAAAKIKAKEYAKYNAAGGVASLILQDSDIEFGFRDAAGTYTPLPSYIGFPNTIKVKLRRDSQANGNLSLFFGRVFGVG